MHLTNQKPVDKGMWNLIEQLHEGSHENKADVWKLGKIWLLKLGGRERIVRRMPSRRHDFVWIFCSGIVRNFHWRLLWQKAESKSICDISCTMSPPILKTASVKEKKDYHSYLITSLTNHNLPHDKDNDSASPFTNIEKLIKSSNNISPNFLFKCN